MSEMYNVPGETVMRCAICKSILVYDKMNNTYLPHSVQDCVRNTEVTITVLAERLKAAQDAIRLIEYIAKYDGSDNNRRSWQEEFTFIRVKAIDWVRQHKALVAQEAE
jgi:hypothetical protein